MFQIIALNKKNDISTKVYSNASMAMLCAEQFKQYGSKVILKQPN